MYLSYKYVNYIKKTLESKEKYINLIKKYILYLNFDL